jgi:ubiquinone/menaquinone biosynthesis C-methylase UbiE
VGSVLRVPFDDNSFDLVVSIDVLEHLPQQLRQTAIDEIIRVSSNTVIVGCPAGKAAAEIDKNTLHVYFRNKIEEAVWWLKDHINNGLPTLDDLESYIFNAAKSLKKDILLKKEKNINIAVYRKFINSFMTQRRIFFPLLSRRMVKHLRHFYRVFNFGKTYRTIYVIKITMCP